MQPACHVAHQKAPILVGSGLRCGWIHILHEHRTRQDEERLAIYWHEHDLVFPTTEGTMFEATNLVNRYFKPALKRASLPADKVQFHDLRHGAASMLIVLGYDSRTIADILGHSSPSFTMRQYAHSFEEVRDRAVVDIGALLKSKARNTPADAAEDCWPSTD